MPITIPDYAYVPDRQSNINNIVADKAVEAFYWKGGFNSGISRDSQLTYRSQGSASQSDTTRQPMLGGKDVKTILVNNNTLEGKQFTVNGVEFTMLATPVADTDIDIGADANGSATNIKNKLDGYDFGSADIITATVATATVTITGSTVKALTVTTTDTTEFTVATGTAIPATLPVQFSGDFFLQDTVAAINVLTTTEDALGNVYEDLICVETLIPAGITTFAQLVTTMLAVWTHATAGTTPVSGSTKLGFIYSTTERTLSQIKDALRAIFGSTAASSLVLNSGSDGFDLKALGTDHLGFLGNGVQVEFGFYASEPDIDLRIDENGSIIANGVQGSRIVGISAYSGNAEVNATTIPQIDELVDQAEVATGQTQSVELVYNEVLNARLASNIASSAVATATNHRVVMRGGKKKLPIIGLIVKISTGFPGKFHLEIVPAIYVTTPLNIKYGKGTVDGLKLGGKVVPKPGQANIGIFNYFFEQASAR